MRTDEFKLGSVNDGNNNYEVIKWENILFDKNTNLFKFTGITRGAEDTTQFDVSLKNFSYYPALGIGTSAIAVPASSFVSLGNNEYESLYEFDVQLPTDINWSAITCMFATNSMKDGLPVILRSPITLLEYGGARS